MLFRILHILSILTGPNIFLSIGLSKMRIYVHSIFFLLWHCDPTRVMASSFLMFLDHTQPRTTVGRTHLDEWSARRRDLYLTTHNTHNRQTSMPPVGFEPTISAGEGPQTYAFDRAATGTGKYVEIVIIKIITDGLYSIFRPENVMFRLFSNLTLKSPN